MLEETAPNEHEELLGRAIASEVGDTMRLRMKLQDMKFNLNARTMMGGLPIPAQSMVIGVANTIGEFLVGVGR